MVVMVMGMQETKFGQPESSLFQGEGARTENGYGAARTAGRDTGGNLQKTKPF